MKLLKYTLMAVAFVFTFSVASNAQDKDRNDPPPKKDPPVVVVKEKEKPKEKPKEDRPNKPQKPAAVLPETKLNDMF